MHEVPHVAQVVLGVHGGQAHVVLVRLSGQGWNLGDQTVNRQIDVREVAVGILRFRVEGGQRRHHRAQHAHGVSPQWKRIEETFHVFMHQGVVRDAVGEVVEFFLVGQIPVDEEVGHLHKGCLFRQFLNGVTAVAQDAVLSIEVRDAALGRTRVLEARVHGDVPGGAAKLRNVDGFLVFSTRQNGEFVFLSFQDKACSVTHGEKRLVCSLALLFPALTGTKTKGSSSREAQR